jgi:hypothetical protein
MDGVGKLSTLHLRRIMPVINSFEINHLTELASILLAPSTALCGRVLGVAR